MRGQWVRERPGSGDVRVAKRVQRRAEHRCQLPTAWQMTLGGLMLAPVTLAVEGLPATLTAANVAGYVYLATIGGALAYVLWFRGIERLSPTTVSLLTLSNPLTATLAGPVVLGQALGRTAPAASDPDVAPLVTAASKLPR